VTREKVDILLKWLDKLGLGTDDGVEVHKLQSTRGDALLALAVLVALYLVPHLIFPSALEQIKDQLRGVSDRIENLGYIGSNEDAKVVSEPMDDIRAVVIDRRVSSEARTGPVV
jgi:hypothetical protein